MRYLPVITMEGPKLNKAQKAELVKSFLKQQVK